MGHFLSLLAIETSSGRISGTRGRIDELSSDSSSPGRGGRDGVVDFRLGGVGGGVLGFGEKTTCAQPL